MFDVHAREPGLKPNHTQYLSLLHVRISELNVLSNQYHLIADTRTRGQNRLSTSAKTIVSYSLIKLTLFTGGEDADHHRHLLWSVLAASALLHSGYGDHQHGQVGGQ